ncbi:MAG: DUF3833 domain-containing protein [Halieaceae bacterium]|jgi:hypothetical protein|nr:DUF3833 domain-containing protein [Halieaceae bacterium]
MKRRTTLLVLLVFTLGGCATSLDGLRYTDQTPPFDLFAFFEGTVDAWGVVQNRSGEVVQRFDVVIRGTVRDDELTLDERFTYALGDGVRERVWRIRRQEDGSYSGEAGDILDRAEGESFGNAFRWAYAMDLPVGGKTYRVRFEDWIFALDSSRLLNRSYIQKFGLDVAEVTIFMQRRDAPKTASGEAMP